MAGFFPPVRRQDRTWKSVEKPHGGSKERNRVAAGSAGCHIRLLSDTFTRILVMLLELGRKDKSEMSFDDCVVWCSMTSKPLELQSRSSNPFGLNEEKIPNITD